MSPFSGSTEVAEGAELVGTAFGDCDVLVFRVFFDGDEAAVLKGGNDLCVKPAVVASIRVFHVGRVVLGDEVKILLLAVLDEVLLGD